MPPPSNPHMRFRREVLERLARIESKVDTVLIQEGKMAATLDDILADVASESTVIDSVLALLQKVAAENDPTKRQAIVDAITADTAKLNAALTAGTGTPPLPPPAP